MSDGHILDASDVSEALISALIAQGRVRRIRVADGREAVLIPGDVWETMASELEDVLDEQDDELAEAIGRARAEPATDYRRLREALGLAP